MNDKPDLPEATDPGTIERREFLERCGRFAAVTTPAITMLLSTTLSSGAIAGSGGAPGRSGHAPARGRGRTPPGHGGTPPGHGRTPPGHGRTPPGHGGRKGRKNG